MEALMVVDDNRLAREVLARNLRQAGYKVHTASEGQEALQLLVDEPIDLILLDYYMQPMAGLEVLERVRRIRAPWQIPIVMMSSSRDQEMVLQVIQTGANDFLHRPFHLPLLLAKIRQLLTLRTTAPPPASQAAASPQLSREVVLTSGTLVGPYQIEKPMGEGGAGRVYRAFDTRLHRPVALKLFFEGQHHAPVTDRFMAEARALARVRHPGVAIIYDVGSEPCPYLAMELVEGPSLQKALQPVPAMEQAVNWTLEILEALQAIHQQNLLHRDLKPDNLLLTPEGHIKIVDFGIAEFLHDSPKGEGGELCGTPEFMSPEQIKNDGSPIDARSDLFSVGSILYLLLAGRPPFPAQTVMQQLFLISTEDPDPPSSANPAITPALEAVILRALQKEPQERFADAAEFARALAEAAAPTDP